MKFLPITLILPMATSLALPSETSPNAALVLRQETGFQTHQCKIVGSGNAYCRTCDKSSCNSVKTLHVGEKYGFICVCRKGECKDGLCGWDFLADLNCWVWAGRTDGNCPTAGKSGLTECGYCSR